MKNGIIKIIIALTLVIGLSSILLIGCEGIDNSLVSTNYDEVLEAIPDSPSSGFEASAGDQRITLNWDPVIGADSYNVYWSNTTGTGTTGTKVTNVQAPFYHNELSNNLAYYYVVTAVNGVGESDPSIEKNATATDILISDLNFTDANLTSCVNATTATYVHDLINLNCMSKNITYLDGIQALTSVKYLELSWNSITNVNALTSMTNIVTLSLYINQINDIASLSTLTKLSTLKLRGNQVTDISPLSNLTELYNLSLEFNKISNVSPLANLTNLTTLIIYNNNISDIAPLSNLTKLSTLSMKNNSISQISSLSNILSLTFLDFGYNSVSDLTPVTNLTNLTTLSINNNNINDITPLSNLTNLTRLSAGGNTVSNIAPLSNLINLTTLALNDNNITDISPLSSLSTKLVDLSLYNNNIVDVSSLSGLTKLTYLNLRKNSIGGEGIGNVNTLTNLVDAGEIGLSDNITMSCSELSTLISTLGSPPVDAYSFTTNDVATDGINCTNP